MDIQTVWLLMLSVATPIAGVVGFAIQLRQVKKTKLENEKLQLEVAALKAVQAERGQRIVAVTTEEVIRYNDRPVFSRGRGPNPGPEPHESGPTLAGRATASTLAALALLVIAYAAYDVYRAIRWLANAL
jgi:hypothetical protein